MAIWEEFNNIDARDYAALHPELFAYVKDAMAQPGKQYLLIGDTDHDNEGDLEKFKKGPILAALFKHAAVPHVAVETARELATPDELSLYRLKVSAAKKGMLPQEGLAKAEKGFWRKLEATWRKWVAVHPHNPDRPALDQLTDNLTELAAMEKRGEITPEKAQDVRRRMDECWMNDKREYTGPQTLGFIHAGLRVTAADSWQWQNIKASAPLVGLAHRIFLGDREVAHYIAGQARGQKTGVVYGASHFYYQGAMASRLGRDKCVHVDIFADRDHYQKTMMNDEMYTDYMPDRVYLVKERTLERPDERLYRLARTRDKDPRQLVKQVIVRTFGQHANPVTKAKAIEKMDVTPDMDPVWLNYEPA